VKKQRKQKSGAVQAKMRQNVNESKTPATIDKNLFFF